jgi:uncharacterized membrane protein
VKILATILFACFSATIALALLAPYGGMLLNAATFLIPLNAAGVIALLVWAQKRQSVRRWMVAIVALLFAAGSYFVLIAADFRNNLCAPALDGVVLRKELSSNHQYPLLVIQNYDGTTVRLEGVSDRLFSASQVGDHLQKLAGARQASEHGTIFPVADASPIDALRFQ